MNKTLRLGALFACLAAAGAAQAGIMGSLVKGAAFGAGAAAASEAVHAAVKESKVDCKFPKNQHEKDKCSAAAPAPAPAPAAGAPAASAR